jgi:hypothetical protein
VANNIFYISELAAHQKLHYIKCTYKVLANFVQLLVVSGGEEFHVDRDGGNSQ